MKNILAASLLLFLSACSGFNAASTSTLTASGTSTPSLGSSDIPTTGTNVMKVQVGNCGTYGYVNEPCVSVTICTPGTTTCQTINNILLDTGSYGLRIFGSQITVALNAVTSGSGLLNECVGFMDGSADWGPVQRADVVLGSETAANVPIHVLGTTNVPSGCGTPDSGPAEAGFNGILGVGLFSSDCGAACVTDASNGQYYVCSGSSCSQSVAALANQVTNPVAMLPADNNGVVLMLPSVAATGSNYATGALVLGIGTQTNNQMTGRTIQADGTGNMVTSFNGQTYSSSFLDSGSNALYMPGDSVLAKCPDSVGSSFYCPSTLTSLNAIIAGTSGSNGINVPFQVMSVANVATDGAYNDIAGSNSNGFDWGLPFFYGRSVAVGIEGTSSTYGSGPYWVF